MVYRVSLVGSTFGGLQGIQFRIFHYLSGLSMAGHIADSRPPFYRRVRKALAILAGGVFLDFLTTFALLQNLVAATSIELTPCLLHKKALQPFLYRYTNHGYHILSLEIDKKIKTYLLIRSQSDCQQK